MTIAALSAENARLKALLAQTLAEVEEARRRLEVIVGELRRDKFGAKSEKLSADQCNLPLEDVEIAQGILDAAQEKAEAAIKGKSAGGASSRNRNRGHCPPICRGWSASSSRTAPFAPAVAVRWPGSARMFRRDSI